jgi:hypothetical protein
MNFVLGNQQVVKLATDNYTPVDVLCFFTTGDALSLLRRAYRDSSIPTPLEKHTLLNLQRNVLGQQPYPVQCEY